jgi:flagellar hook-length control protein FliK
MNATTNVSAIVEIKGGKAAGKLLLPGALALQGDELMSFEQLLGDSAAQLVTDAVSAPVLGSAPLEEQPESDPAPAMEILVVDAALLPTDAPAPTDTPAPTDVLQVWQGWLTNTPSAPSLAAAPVGAEHGSDESALTSAITAQPQRREANAPAEARAEVVAPAQLLSRGADAKEEFAVANLVPASGTAATSERAAAMQVEPVAVSNDLQAALSASQPETRKVSAAPVQVVNIALPLRAPEWSSAFSEQVVLLVSDGGGRAELRLNPAELGPIDVSLNVQDDRVHASFTIHHAATLDAVQAALPKLEQMMAERGVQLDSVSVETNERRQEQHSEKARGGNEAGGQRRRDGEKDNAQTNRRIVRGNGLVDTFA